jgi:hypothetical protein
MHQKSDKNSTNMAKTRSEIIIMIHANEQMGTEEDGIGSMATTCNLTDIHAHQHEGINNLAKKLVDKATASEYLAFYDGMETYHRGSFVDFDADKLFRDKTATPHSHAQRVLPSKLPKTVKKYI